MKCRLRGHADVQIAILMFGLGLSTHTRTADAQSATAPLSPQESLQQIVVDSDLKAELAAHEPNVIDPIAIRFDEDGRMWVVEMRDYPTGPTKEFPARSRISTLRDKDNDGFYETAAVFADNLSFATGLQPWKGGVFVTLAGKVVYMKDTDGDGKADVNETWYTGFSQVNQQLRANHPTLALDNHIYVAGGLRGGTITDSQRPNVKPVSISSMDFRFDPLTRKFEAVTGLSQFGISFDDYGNRFACANRDPALHAVLENAHLKKNPLVTVDVVLEDVVYGDHKTHIYPIGRAWTTSNLHAGEFTAACGIEIYRGDALPARFYGNVFTCEPTGYLVHREVIRPHGVTFTETFQKHSVEFFASRDEWCRPVNLEVGPDGALYIVDMYRQIIEHPEWMPEELRQRPNLRAGNDRGRIFRIIPKDFQRPAPSKLSALSSDALVDALASPNVWRRETAARLLVERQDTKVGAKLRQTALRHPSVPARILALRLLEGIKRADEKLLLTLCDDSNPRIVEQAIIVADAHVANSRKLRDRIARLVAHKDARVRFQALLVALPLPSAPKYTADKWEADAMLIAAGNRGGDVLKSMLASGYALQSNLADPQDFVARLARLAAASKDERQQATAVDALTTNPEFGRAGLTGLFDELARGGTTVATVRAKLSEQSRRALDETFAAARRAAADAREPEAAREGAIDLLAYTADAPKVLLPLATQDPSQAVRLRAIAALSKTPGNDAWRELLTTFNRNSPALQSAILDGVLTSADRTGLLLDAIAAGAIKPTAIDAVRAKLVLNNRNSTIRQRAAQLLASAVPADREKVLAEYRPALDLKSDPARGREIFEKRCSACHVINNVGVKFAPDISDSRERTPLQLLTDILQPNRAIDSNFFSYTIVTTDGRVRTGVLAAETSNSVTLKQQDGKSETIRRDEIEDFRSDGVSYMPEGLEKDIPPQDMADLIAFIKNWRYLENPHEFTPAGK
jgi:putative membrane-bound dehydrogenase-like protein